MLLGVSDVPVWHPHHTTGVRTIRHSVVINNLTHTHTSLNIHTEVERERERQRQRQRQREKEKGEVIKRNLRGVE